KPAEEKANDPTVKQDPDHQGGMIVEPGEDNNKVTIDFPGEDDKPNKVVINKDPDSGEWKPEGELPEGVHVDKDTGKVTIDPDAVKDGGNVSVKGEEDGKTPATPDPVAADDDKPAAPTVVIQDGDDETINGNEADDGVKVKITFDPKNPPKAGDTLKVDTDGDGQPDFEKELTDKDIKEGVTVTIPKNELPENGKDLTVTAKTESPKGDNYNSEPGKDTSHIDLPVAPNPGDDG
ncbi:hypothetical protein HPC37_10750, partial [Pasteurellaceae bacterium 20609_3]|uniref:hypothetical protein n=1 Tax=Spirabiliibacterium mucosae TaxID=28156 RepID=UPI001AAC6CDA